MLDFAGWTFSPSRSLSSAGDFTLTYSRFRKTPRSSSLPNDAHFLQVNIWKEVTVYFAIELASVFSGFLSRLGRRQRLVINNEAERFYGAWGWGGGGRARGLGGGGE